MQCFNMVTKAIVSLNMFNVNHTNVSFIASWFFSRQPSISYRTRFNRTTPKKIKGTSVYRFHGNYQDSVSVYTGMDTKVVALEIGEV